MRLPQGCAGSRSNSSEPIPMVQCGCLGLEEGRYSAFLHGLQVPQCAYEEGLVPFALHSGGLGKHGGVSIISHQWISSWTSGKLKWSWDCNSTRPSQWVTLGSMSLPACRLGCAMHLRCSSIGELNLMHCVICLDDIIVFGRMEEEHLEHLHMVLERFWEFNLKLKPSKCSFFQSEIVYLAHHVL